MRIPLVGVVFVSLLSSCGPSSEEVFGTYRSQVQGRVQRMEAITRTALARTEELPEPKDVELRFGQGGNARLVHAERLDEPVEYKPELDLIVPDTWLTWVQEGLRGQLLSNADVLRDACEELLAVRYLVVIRTREYSAPIGLEAESFAGGRWIADLVIGDAESGELLGSLAVEAENDDTVRVDVKRTESWLRSNLWENARRAVNASLAPLCRGDAKPIG